MKSSFAALVVAFSLVGVGGAGANGSPFSPGLVHAWDGVLAPSGDVRFVTLDAPMATVVAGIRVRDGRILRSRFLRGSYGVPLVAYDGTPGGLSGDGRWLVVASYGPFPGTSGTTRFAILATKTFKLRRLIVLDGSWSYDAIAPDGSTLFFTQHLSAGKNPVYRVRTFDVATGLLRGAIVDRLEGEEEMGGEPVTRATSPDGRWAYTLYARRKHEPFVHALDTTRKEAFCIDLPLQLAQPQQMELRLKLGGKAEALTVHLGRVSMATIDTESFAVRRG